jgi:excisionase family DNA binding protein
MEQIFLNGINVEQLLEKIGKLLDSRLNNTATPKTQIQPQYLSRKEVCTLLKISLPTLSERTKAGFLQSYRVGNRVLYKLTEIEHAVKNSSLNTNKKNRP